MITAEQIKEALEFFNYNIGEGVYDETILVGLSEEAIVDLYKKESARGDYLADQAEEEYYEALQENMEEQQATGN